MLLFQLIMFSTSRVLYEYDIDETNAPNRRMHLKERLEYWMHMRRRRQMHLGENAPKGEEISENDMV